MGRVMTALCTREMSYTSMRSRCASGTRSSWSATPSSMGRVMTALCTREVSYTSMRSWIDTTVVAVPATATSRSGAKPAPRSSSK